MSQVDQPAVDPVDPAVSADAVDAESLARCSDLFETVKALTRPLADAVEERALVDDVAAAHPQAAWITLSNYDPDYDRIDPFGPCGQMDVVDAEGNPLSSTRMARRTQRMDADPDGAPVVLNMAEVLARDLDTVRDQVEESFVERFGGFRPPF